MMTGRVLVLVVLVAGHAEALWTTISSPPVCTYLTTFAMPTHSLLVCLSFPWRNSAHMSMVIRDLERMENPAYVLFPCCQELPARPTPCYSVMLAQPGRVLQDESSKKPKQK